MGSTGVRRRAGGPKRHIASAQMSGDQREAVPACRWCNHREAVQSRPRQPADQRLALSISACSIPGVYSLSLALIQSTFGPVYRPGFMLRSGPHSSRSTSYKPDKTP